MEISQHTPNVRLAGLDTLRAIAILSVMTFHLGGYMPQAWYPATRFGWAGVDLFFVLSGYLIGSQLLRDVLIGNGVRFGQFYRNRAYRILPAYFAVLLLYNLWPVWREGNGLSPIWEFLTFTLNLFIVYPAQNTFSHAWSLCVEEHFYLLLPLLVFILARKATMRKTVLIILAVVAAGIALRYWFLIHELRPVVTQRLPFAIVYIKRIYYPSYAHFDGLVMGVGIALLQLFRSAWWQRLSGYSNWLLAAGIVLTSFSLWLFRDRFELAAGAAAVSVVIGFPMLSFGLGLLVVVAAMPGTLLSRTSVPGAKALATIAFSLYLTHNEVANVLYHYLPKYMDEHPLQGTLMIWPLSFAAAGVLYLAVERPFLKLRNRGRFSKASPNEQARLNPGI